MKKILIAVVILFIASAGFKVYLSQEKPADKRTPLYGGVDQTGKPQKDVEVIAEGLNIPWEIAFLPDGEMLVTERPGNLIKMKGSVIIPIEGVRHIGEGGLLGLAIHPNFASNHWIYLYHTAEGANGLTNVVERYKLEANQVTEKKVILSGIVGASNHDGGRIAFGPDGLLYVTTGDAANEPSSQNINSLNGKILRVTDEGQIPADNPFRTAVYSYGHRNAQGLAWDDQNNLWATEHGRSGIKSGLDELNKIEKGKNYGWPTIQGLQTRPDMVTPVINSGEDDTWAPEGAAFYNGKIFFGGLRGEALYEYNISDGAFKTHLKGEFKRIRAVVLGPDKYLYISTSNTDNRTIRTKGDDKLIRVNPESLK